MLTIQLFIDGSKCDMFDDVSVNITDTIKDAKDISKVFTSFSMPFKLPASKSNNKIFQHAYRFNISNGFDVRRKYSSLLKLNGIDYQKGYIKLNEIEMKDNIAESYNIQFFGELTTLKDRFGEDILEDLDYLQNYNHGFNITNVKGGFETSLKLSGGSMTIAADTSGEIIYPLITHTRGLQYSTTDGLYDIIETGTPNSQDRLTHTDLKPAIKVPAIIDAIERKYNIRFTGKFLDSTAITELYLWCHKRKGAIVTDAPETNQAQYIGSIQDMTKDSFTKASDDPSGYDVEIHDQVPGTGQPANSDWDKYVNLGLFGTIPADPDNERDFITYRYGFLNGDANYMYYDGTVTITPDAAFTSDYSFYLYSSNTGVYHISQTGLNGASGALAFTIDSGNYDVDLHDLAFKITSDGLDEFDVDISITGYRRNDFDIIERTRVWAYSQTVTSAQLITEARIPFNMPKIKVIDFVTGLFKMFNCVAFDVNETYQDSTYKINVIPYEQYLRNGILRDITKYVDISAATYERITPYQTLEFTYQEPSTFLSKKSNELSKFEFGNLKWTSEDYFDGGTRLLFDGGDYEVNLPFEKVQYQRLIDTDDDTDSEIMYGWFVNDFAENTPESETGKPLLFYLENRSCSTDTIEWTDASTSSVYNCANNVRADGLQTLNFNSEIDEFDKVVNNNSLFANYYQEFITGVYDKTARRVKITAHLPPEFWLNYRLNDKITIAGRTFHIEKVSGDLLTGKATLYLLKLTGRTEVYNIETGYRYWEEDYADPYYAGSDYKILLDTE